MTPDRAARRLNAIAGFREEQRRLEGMGLLSLSAEEKKSIRAYHDEVLADLDQSDDNGSESATYPVHWGMRMAASAGLFVLLGIILFYLDHIWADISNLKRIVLVITAPLILLFLSELLLLTGRSRYFAALLAGLSTIALAAALLGLTRLFNQPAGPSIITIAGGYATALGLRHDNFAFSVCGLIAFVGGLCASLSMITGESWAIIPERPGIFLISGLVLYLSGAMGAAISDPARPVMRLAGLILAGVALIVLGLDTYDLFAENIETRDIIYRIVAVIVFPAAMIAGLITGWRETFYGAAALFGLTIALWFYLWIGVGFPVTVHILSLLALIGAGLWFFSLLHRAMARRLA